MCHKFSVNTRLCHVQTASFETHLWILPHNILDLDTHYNLRNTLDLFSLDGICPSVDKVIVYIEY